jgi:hypothetical protein
MFRFVSFYLSNIDISLNLLFLNKGNSILEIFLSYSSVPIVPELDSFFEQVIGLLSFLEEDLILGFRFFLNTTTLIGAETLLRGLKIPVLLTK